MDYGLRTSASDSGDAQSLSAASRSSEISGAFQRVGAFSELPALARRFGADPAPLLASAGLAGDALDDCEAQVSYAACGVLLARCAQATRQPQFGLIAGRMWHVEDLGLVGEAMRNSATVGEALDALTTHQHLACRGGLFYVAKYDTIVDVGYAIYEPGVEGTDHLYDAALALLFNLLRDLAGPAWAPHAVFVPHARPQDVSQHRSLFGLVPRFDAEVCALRFPRFWLDRPVQGADPQRRRAAVARIAHGAQPEMLDAVARGFRTLLLRGSASGDELAAMLSMHRRTLNRRLREHGTTFQKMLDAMRFELARQLLVYSRVSLDDVAVALGYSGVTPFMRAFRRWSGTTPGHWRRRESVAAGIESARPEFDPSTRADYADAHACNAVALASRSRQERPHAQALCVNVS
jgi:AraC-like DNA-binding protein